MDKNIIVPEYSDIQEAHERIKKIIHNTPVLSSQSINEIFNAHFFFKCDNFQKVGAFKFRGACNAVFSLPEKEAQKGVATHSSGNHAAALSLAAKIRGIKAYIVMPENAPQIKKKAVLGYGGIITFCKPTLVARETTLEKIIKETGAVFVHPYNSFNVVCGQGTAAKELLEEIPDLDIIIAPVGGGGMLSGSAITAKAINPDIKVVAGEPKNADDAYRSFKSGKLIPSENPDTIADGLLTSLSPLTFSIIMNKVDEIFTATERSIIDAMRMVWERMKIIIEPSSAVPLAAIMENREYFKGKKIGIIVTGGNLDLESLPF